MPARNPTLRRIEQRLVQRGLGRIDAVESLPGGCICVAQKINTDSGHQLFIKTHQQAPAQLFPAEAQGLQSLRAATPLRVPRVIAVDPDFLVLEFIIAGRTGAHYWSTLATGLAQLHRQPQPRFGFESDNFCGETPQPNPVSDDGVSFFSEHRLGFQAGLAFDRGLLSSADLQAVETLSAQLRNLVPNDAPALIHGDLWSGNIYCDEHGQPVLIDPACYWGWREADIAMTRLFGALPEEFYRCYQLNYAMQPGWESRMDIYNLYHVLNHLNLFGDSYLAQVRATLKRYS